MCRETQSKMSKLSPTRLIVGALTWPHWGELTVLHRCPSWWGGGKPPKNSTPLVLFDLDTRPYGSSFWLSSAPVSWVSEPLTENSWLCVGISNVLTDINWWVAQVYAKPVLSILTLFITWTSLNGCHPYKFRYLITSSAFCGLYLQAASHKISFRQSGHHSLLEWNANSMWWKYFNNCICRRRRRQDVKGHTKLLTWRAFPSHRGNNTQHIQVQQHESCRWPTKASLASSTAVSAIIKFSPTITAPSPCRPTSRPTPQTFNAK